MMMRTRAQETRPFVVLQGARKRFHQCQRALPKLFCFSMSSTHAHQHQHHRQSNTLFTFLWFVCLLRGKGEAHHQEGHRRGVCGSSCCSGHQTAGGCESAWQATTCCSSGSSRSHTTSWVTSHPLLSQTFFFFFHKHNKHISTRTFKFPEPQNKRTRGEKERRKRRRYAQERVVSFVVVVRLAVRVRVMVERKGFV